MSVQTRVEVRAIQAEINGYPACEPQSPPTEGFDLERVIQLLDELDDLVACVKQAWRPVARRGVGVAGVLAVVLVVTIPA